MDIKVLYQNSTFGEVDPSTPDELISLKKIKKFLRSKGWATVGCAPVRGKGGSYTGPERRAVPRLTEDSPKNLENFALQKEICIADFRRSQVSICNFQALFESAPAPLLVLNPDFQIVAVSDEYLRSTMTTREQIIGHDIFEIFPDNPDDPQATGVRNMRASLDNVLRNKRPDTMAVQKYDIRNPVERGGQFEERYWSPVNSPVLDANKEVEYIIHRVEDVTEFVRLRQKRVEFERLNETLRQHLAQMESEIYVRTQEIAQANLHLKELNAQITQEHEKLKTLVESIDDEVWFYDVQDNVVFMNSAVTRNIGFEKCENCSLTEIFDRLKILNTDGAPRPIEQFPLYRSATYGDNLTDEEIVHHLETGELRHRHYTSAPVRDRTGQIIGAVAIVRDITDIKRLMSRLQEALDNVKILSGILPICSSCKKIKDDDGNWIQLESYIHERSDADFSHGICPDCTKKLYPDFYKKIEEQLRNPANKVSESK